MMSKGAYRVGLDFNPSGDDLVTRLKQAAADLIDLIEEIPTASDLPDHLAADLARERGRLKALAQTSIEEAAMWAVKAATKR